MATPPGQLIALQAINAHQNDNFGIRTGPTTVFVFAY